MTPQELKEIALQASKKEYDTVIEELGKSAKEGKFTATFTSLTDGTKELLTKEGYVVKRRLGGNRNERIYWDISFGV